MSGLRLMSVAWVLVAMVCGALSEATRQIPVAEYIDKMEGGWLGQIAGVSWAAPTEFKWRDAVIPAEDMPAWAPEKINHAFGQDDLYVEMTFLRTLEEYGLGASIRQAGIDFANSEYRLWCANAAGRKNLRRGIAPPDSSHPRFNRCPNDIDYQIEADYAGLISPGMPQAVIGLGEKFGRLMNYGDGMYGGQFMGGMYAEAFFEADIRKIIRAGLACIPADSQYAEMVRDMLKWHEQNPSDWEATWGLCQKKYRETPEYQKASNGGIDVKINGAYVLMGLLYGNGDIDKTIIISTRCGQDSDCNPSSAAGVLCATLGFSKLPARFTGKLDRNTKFSYTAYTFSDLIRVCEKLARQIVTAHGGRVERGGDGTERFIIPRRSPVPSPTVSSWAPGPVEGSRFTGEEYAKIRFKPHPADVEDEDPTARVQKAADVLFPGWRTSPNGKDMNPGYREEHAGRQHVMMTHPLDRTHGVTLTRVINVPGGPSPKLRVVIANHGKGDFQFIARVNGEEKLKETIGGQASTWREMTIDLASHVGKAATVELVNEPNGWSSEAAYWGAIELEP